MELGLGLEHSFNKKNLNLIINSHIIKVKLNTYLHDSSSNVKLSSHFFFKSGLQTHLHSESLKMCEFFTQSWEIFSGQEQ